MTIKDLFDISTIDSLTGSFFKEQKIQLESEPEHIIKIDPTYKLTTIKLPETNYHKSIGKFVNTFLKVPHKWGLPEQFDNALYEAILNAHQHGHQKDPSKEISIHAKKQKDALRIYVSDEGGNFPAELIPYIQKLRQTDLKKYNVNFYDFSKLQANKENGNLGQGNFFMNLYSDDVRYYKNDQNGLTVFMVKQF